MKIIDAVWEKRNLGVSCHELIVEKDDRLIDISIVENLQSEYQVIKIPMERSDLIFEIQKKGFDFSEVLFDSLHELNLPRLSPTLSRLSSLIDCREADSFGIESVKSRILNGIFKTDRVAIDPYFGVKKSAQRYVGWLTDEINSGSRVYELIYKNRSVGFFVIKCKDGICDARIGGVYSDSNVLGLGVLLNYFEIVVAKNLDCHTLHGAFSSNNPSVFNINDILGYKSKPKFNVFVKHKF